MTDQRTPFAQPARGLAVATLRAGISGRTIIRRSLATPSTLVALLAASALAGAIAPSVASGGGLPGSAAPVSAAVDAEPHQALVGRYCVRCHNDRLERGGLTLESFELARPELAPEVAEKMIRKLRVGMMPPPGAPRPPEAEIAALADHLETTIDTVAAADPDPGRRPFQRLNRAEYRRSVEDLLGLVVDVEAFLPADTVSHGFDNVADVQGLSATLMEGYLRAAADIARRAVGDPGAGPAEATYTVPRTASQLERVPGAPFGSRGGVSIVHAFPADGEYVFRITLHSTPTGELFGSRAEGEQIEVSIDGQRVALLDLDPLMNEAAPAGMTMETGPIVVRSGSRRVSAAFPVRFWGPIDDLLAPIEHTLADTQIGIASGITTLPHLRSLAIGGPYRATGVFDTPSRRRIFTCRPTAAAEEIPCARAILSALAERAYRRPVDDHDLEGLLGFYRSGAAEGGFESGIRKALQAILASPHFVLRLEQVPQDAVAGESFRIGPLDLASRLSYFLWASGPDAELIATARAGRLGEPAELERQVLRMLGDPRASALATRFAAQWLRLQDLDRLHPDALMYPHYDQTLAASMRRETERFFEHVVRADRPVLELIDADYTFVDERLARHYGLPGVTGSEHRRAQLADEGRRGLLGHGSILALTSHATRTSPVLRGKWVMEVLLGSPPPPPPPDVPDLEQTEATAGGRALSVRERLEEHRSNPACRSCHRVIDPIGLALESFDVTGARRIRDGGVAVDTTGTLFDGAPLAGPADLRNALLKRADVVLTTFTENLLAYALGRRLEVSDMPTVRRIVREAGDSEHRFSAFVLGVVRSDAFCRSRLDPAGVAVADDGAGNDPARAHREGADR
ncbi:MAG TPA: DUF1592 domain-containing protein [Thermoanaerobaculia bacterium]|nr:DUF1592 domain-containing protein [Thermoanaerobaculia bacterium]